MAASKVPKFGEWEGGENYTLCFDNARKTKNNGHSINPNDPEDYKGQKTKVPQFGAWDNEENLGYTVCFENARRPKYVGPTASENEPQMSRDMHPRNGPEPESRQEARSRVPKFGAWEARGEVGYTQCFENLRQNNKKERAVNVVNPEPSDAHKLNRDVQPQAKEGHSRVPRFGGWNGGEEAQYTACFDNARINKNAGHVMDTVEPQLNRDVSGDRARPLSNGGKLRNTSKGSSASETSLIQRKQNPGVQLPAYQKGARLQLRTPAAGTAEKGAAVLAWGVWNTDPRHAEDFTSALRRAKEERNTPLNSNSPPSYHHQKPQYQKPKEGCCFGWF